MNEEDDFVRRSQAHQARMMMPGAFIDVGGAFIDVGMVSLPRPLRDGKAIARLAFLSHQKARRKERRHKRAVREWHKLEAIMWHRIETYGADALAAQEAELTVGMYANPQDVLSKD